MCMYWYFIIQIPHSILFGSFGDLTQWPVDEEVEAKQKNKGQKINYCKRNINWFEQSSTFFTDQGNRTVDQQISFCSKSFCYRCNDSDIIFIKISVICTDQGLIAANFCRIKIF